MVTLNEIAYNVLNTMKGGRATNNEYPSIDQVKYWVKQYRALLLRRDFQRPGMDRPEEYEQELSRISFDYLPSYEGLSFGQPEGSDSQYGTLRTSEPIPMPVRFKGELGFTYIGTPDLNHNFDLVSAFEVNIRNQFDKYTKTTIRATFRNQHIWITNYPLRLIPEAAAAREAFVLNSGSGYEAPDSNPTVLLTVKGIFEDPGVAFEYAGYTFDDDSTLYPAPADFAARVAQAILGGEARSILGNPTDVILNTLPDTNTSVQANV